MKVLKKRLIISTLLVLMVLTPQLVFALAQAYPFFYVSISPKVGEVEAGNSATFEIRILSQEGYEGDVRLELIDAPEGITATFEPNPVFVPGYSEEFATFTIDVDSTVSEGEIELSILGTDVAGVAKERGASLVLTVSEVAASGPPPASSGPASSPGPASSGVIPPEEVITTTVTATVTTSTTLTTETIIISTVTKTITTKTSVISSKTTVDVFDQAYDLVYPLVTLTSVIGLLGVAVIRLRK